MNASAFSSVVQILFAPAARACRQVPHLRLPQAAKSLPFRLELASAMKGAEQVL
jgi:hypothetical protein